MGPSDATASLKLSAAMPICGTPQPPSSARMARTAFSSSMSPSRCAFLGVEAPAPIVFALVVSTSKIEGPMRFSGTTVRQDAEMRSGGAVERWAGLVISLCPARLTKLPAYHPVNAQAKSKLPCPYTAKKNPQDARTISKPPWRLPGGRARAPLPKTRCPPRNEAPSTAAQKLRARRPGGSPITPHARRRHETPPPARETAPKN